MDERTYLWHGQGFGSGPWNLPGGVWLVKEIDGTIRELSSDEVAELPTQQWRREWTTDDPYIKPDNGEIDATT